MDSTKLHKFMRNKSDVDFKFNDIIIHRRFTFLRILWFTVKPFDSWIAYLRCFIMHLHLNTNRTVFFGADWNFKFKRFRFCSSPSFFWFEKTKRFPVINEFTWFGQINCYNFAERCPAVACCYNIGRVTRQRNVGPSFYGVTPLYSLRN